MSPDLLVGVPVVGPKGQQIGEVRYLAVDKKTGEADLVFVNVSFFGPDANIAVRPTELKMKGDKLEIDRTPDQLMASPKFGKVDLINHYGTE